VKEYLAGRLARRLGHLLRAAPPLREWRATHQLALRGVAAPSALALVLAAPLAAASSFVLLEAIAAEPVNRYVLRCCVGSAARVRRLRLLDAVADRLRSLHERGIEHRDLKGSNLLVRECDTGFELFLVDLAEVRFSARVTEAHRLEALAQLNASMPLAVRRSERLRFLARYAPGTSRSQRARRFRVVERLTRARNCVWDVGYSGRELTDPPR